jgi:rare lipoprotein A
MQLHAQSRTGTASFYGRAFDGKRMANGMPFDPKKLTCASRRYRLGTHLLVTYPTTGKSVVVVVTDRGPWKDGREIDLSEQAAIQLGMHSHGTGQVTIEPLEDK